MIFQDTFGSLNPRQAIGDILRYTLQAHGMQFEDGGQNKVLSTLDRVGLSRASAQKFPHEFSGGQR